MNEDIFLDSYYESQTELPEIANECDSGRQGNGSDFDDFEDMTENLDYPNDGDDYWAE